MELGLSSDGQQSLSITFLWAPLMLKLNWGRAEMRRIAENPKKIKTFINSYHTDWNRFD